MAIERLAQTVVVDPIESRILLAYHKSGMFAGNYTGLLDEVQTGEQPEDAAHRIASEQSSIVVGPIVLRAILTFTSPDGASADEYEFYSEDFTGVPTETSDRRAEWFSLDAIPYENMPADDAIWYPPFLDGKLQRGTFNFDTGMVKLLDYQLSEVETL